MSSPPHGKTVYVLIFFTNLRLDAAGKANVRCDLKLTAPVGRDTLAQNDLACFAGRFVGSPDHLRLSGPVSCSLANRVTRLASG